VEPTFWRAPAAEDAAILRVPAPLPDGTAPLLLGSSDGTSGHEFVSFGFAEKEGEGGSSGYGRLGDTTRLSGTLADGSVVRDQLVRQLTDTTEVTAGYSGGPVYDRKRRRVVGMVRTFAKPDEFGRRSETAFVTPCETLRQACPLLVTSDVCPYPGLRAFEEQDADVFFGRTRTLNALLERLGGGSRFLAVLGPSGSGKSSLVQASLIPQLRAGALPGSQGWEPLLIRPTADPFHALRQSGLLGNSEDLRAGVQAWLAAHPAATRLLLVLDPFDELLLKCPKDRFSAFATQLTHIVDTLPEITLVLVMRDDFYSQLTRQSPSLREWLPRGLVNVPWELEPDELRQIIAGPAQWAGFELEAGLEDRISEDALRSAGVETSEGPVARGTVLPLLEFALRQTWEQRQEGVLTSQAYGAAGGVEGALPQWAERTWTELGEARQPVARRILTGLVHLGEESQTVADVPQRKALGELFRDERERDEVHEVVGMLADARLLVTSRDETSNEEAVELISPALLRWGRLREWVDEDRRFLAWRQELERRARAWFDTDRSDLGGRDAGRLLRGRELGEAEGWLGERGDALGEGEQEYIRAGVQARERERAERERAQRLIRTVLAASTVLALVLAGTTGLGWRRAERQRQISLARYLAEESLTIRQSVVAALPRAALLAVESLRRYPTTGASQVLQRSLPLLVRPVSRMAHEGPVRAVAFSPDGRWVVSGSWDNTARVWEAATGQEVARVTHKEGVSAVAFSPDGRWVVSGSSDNTARVWEAATGREVAHMAHEGGVSAAAFSPDGRWVVSGSSDNTARVWEAATGREVARMTHEDYVSAVCFSPDGRWVVSGSSDNTARVWEAATGREVARITHEYYVSAVAFSPDGRWVVSGGWDNTVRVWEAATGRELARMTHEHYVSDVAFSPDGRWVASAGDEHVAVWEAATGRELARMVNGSPVNHIAFSPDGRWVASASGDHTARVWEAATGREVARMAHDNEVWTVAFSPQGRWVVSSGWDNTARVWEAATGREVARMTHEGAVLAVSFSPDGRWVASAGDDRTLQLWLWRPQDLIAEACSCLSRNLTQEEWRQYLPGEPYRKTCPDLP